MSSLPDSPIGFIGMGTMGEPMALNLIKAGTFLVIWNRSLAKTEKLTAAGADLAATAEDVFQRCPIIILMLENETAIDSVLGREHDHFSQALQGQTVINMGTTSPEYSKNLETDLRAFGVRYVEAPVSGSRKPAEAGRLVAMLAGEPDVVDQVRPLLTPMCHETMVCGTVPKALLMKLSSNLFLIPMVTGLAESVHFAQSHGLDLSQLMAVLNAGPMASDVSRVKIAKLVQEDFTAQACIYDVLKNNRLVAQAARDAGIASPLLDVCHSLYAETDAMGFSNDDMISVLRAIEARSDRSNKVMINS